MSTKKTEVFALRMSGPDADAVRAAAKAAGKKPATMAREHILASLAGKQAPTPRKQRKQAELAAPTVNTASLRVHHIDDLGDDHLRRDTKSLRR